jgi:hypothetical protein
MILEYEGYSFHQTNSEVSIKDAASYLKQRRAEAEEPHPDEVTLPAKFQDAIKLAQKHAQNDWIEADPTHATKAISTRVKTLPEKVYVELLNRPVGSVGAYNYVDQIVYLASERLMEHPFLLYQFILHEEIHRRSKAVYKPKRNLLGTLSVDIYQAGYYLAGNDNSGFGSYRFFNEGITERNKWMILKANIQELQEVLGIDPENAPMNNIYAGFLHVTSRLIRTCNEKNPNFGFEPKIKKGIYTGESDHLQLVDQVYGENSLEIVAKMGKDLRDLNKFDKTPYIDYFSLDTPENERTKIKDKLLAT